MYVRHVFEDERVANIVFEGTGNVEPCGQIGQLRCYITRSFFLRTGQRDQGSLFRFFLSCYLFSSTTLKAATSVKKPVLLLQVIITTVSGPLKCVWTAVRRTLRFF